MPLWRCPHCGTPQAETSRCWVCRRSTTSCATCRHFRRGVAGGLGLCGLDARRAALRGDEMRACWTAPEPAAVAVTSRSSPVGVLAVPAGGRPASGRTFVPVDEAERPPVPADERPIAAVHQAQATDTPRWSLWGDPEG